MKRTFGTFLSRLLNGGVQLTDPEHHILCLLVQVLPEQLRNAVELQFDQYDLVQREIDGRALNFYCKNSSKQLPLLALQAEDCPLIRIEVRHQGGTKTVHATLTAVGGRAFSISLSERIDHAAPLAEEKVVEVVHSWRSNVVAADLPPSQSPAPHRNSA